MILTHHRLLCVLPIVVLQLEDIGLSGLRVERAQQHVVLVQQKLSGEFAYLLQHVLARVLQLVK